MIFVKRAIDSIPLLLALLCVGAYSPAIGEGEAEFTLNLNNTDVYALIETVSNATGRNFVVDPRVSGKVTVISTTPVNAEKLYEMFLSVLQVHGFSAVPAGSLTKIVPDFAAKQGPVPLLETSTEARDQLVSQVIPIINVPADPLVQILRPMVPQEGQLASNPASNSLLVTDRAANIERLIEIIKLIDVPDSEEVDLVHLKQASAADVVRTLSPLQQASGAASSHLISDERTNSILVSGNQAFRNRVRNLIAKLDTPLESGGNTQVVFLNYADAAEIASIISDGDLGTLDSTSSSIAQVTPRATLEQTQNPDNQNGSNQNGGTQNNAPAFRSTATTQTSGSRVSIKIDPNTNSLIITAPPAEMANLLAIIKRLDIRRPQVMVEAVIAEVSEDNIRELGINFLVDGSDGGPVGFSNLDGATGRLVGTINSAGAGLPTPSDGGATVALGNITGGSIDFGLLFNAIASDADNNILSTPTIVTLDNEEAEIVVGTNVPFITGQQLSTNNDNPFQTIERQDVGLRLKVKPQINEGDTIKLELEQEVSSVNATSVTGASDITTSTRSINTTVLVEDGQTLVLGGLNDDMITDVVEKVPLLGDIPVVGRLFQFKSKTKSKTNLMIFLRPVILRDAETANQISSSKYDELRTRRTLAARDKATAGEDKREQELPEIKLFRNNSDIKYQKATGGSIHNRQKALELDIDNKDLEWVEMPDGSLLLK